MQNNLYFVRQTDNGIGQIYKYSAGRLQPVKGGVIKQNIAIGEDEAVFQGADEKLYQMNRRGEIRECPIKGLPDLQAISKELPYTVEENMMCYCLKSKAEDGYTQAAACFLQ